MKTRQRSRRRAGLPQHWLPLFAILLGLLTTVALGRLTTATWDWLTHSASRFVAQAVSPPAESERG